MLRFRGMQKFTDRTHVDLTVLYIFQKAVTFDHNFLLLLEIQGASRPSSKLIVNMFSLCTS